MEFGLLEGSSNLSMENVCRVCRDGSVTLVEIFNGAQSGSADDEDLEKNLTYILSQCANCQVTRDDLLPKQICLSCVIAAQNAFRFKKTCEQSYQHFCQVLEMARQKQRRAPPAERQFNDNEVLMEGGLHVIDVSCIKIEPFVELQEDAKPIKNILTENVSIAVPSSEEQDNRNNEVLTHVCEFCAKGFRGSYELNNHIRSRHTGERPFKCPHCPKDFSVRIYLRNHIRVHTGERPYKCPHCPNAFTLSNTLKAHIRRHNGRNGFCSRKLFRCDSCTASFRRHFALRTHMQLKHRVYDTTAKSIVQANGKCPESSTVSSSTSKTNSNSHGLEFEEIPVEIQKDLADPLMENHTPLEKDQPVAQTNVYHCEICDKNFQYRYQLSNHMRYHVQRPYSCPDPNCSQAFQTDINLKQHQIRFHASDWPFQCKYCPKGFYTNYKLNLHMRSHTGERPFECGHCQQTFTQKQNLNRHITRRHSQVAVEATTSYTRYRDGHTNSNKPTPSVIPRVPIKTEIPEWSPSYESIAEQILPDLDDAIQKQSTCHICGKHFSDTFTLSRHVSGHTVFQCPHCPKSYTQSNNLKSHILSQHEQSSGSTDSGKPSKLVKFKTSKKPKKSNNSNTRTSYRCKWCPIAFREQRKMVLHMQQKHKKRLKQSSIEEQAKLQSLILPIENGANKIDTATTDKDDPKPKNPIKTYKCVVCGKIFSRRFSFIQHIHSHKPPLNCSQCPKQCKFYAQLRIHMRLHPQGRFQCAHCPISYSRKDSLAKHVQKHDNDEMTVEEKDINKTDDIETESDEKGGPLFRCKLCPKSFPYSYNLRLHKLMKHDINEDNYSIEDQQMNWSFEQETHLTLRSRPQAGAYEEIEFEDSDIEKRDISRKRATSSPKAMIDDEFLVPQTLPPDEYHLPNSEGNLLKGNVCPYCSKRYVRKESLIIHMRHHTGERPYKCSYCELSFSSNTACKRHLRGHTGDLFRCDKCTKVYKTRSELRFHTNRIHSTSNEEPIVLTKRLIVRLERIKLPTSVKIEPIDT